MYDTLLKPLESIASDLFETAADLIGEEKGRLNADHSGVCLPRDLYAHTDVQTEWWYYTGHCNTASGHRFGFELVFFKRRTDHDQIGPIPLRMIANPMYAAHFAISEIDRGRFHYEHRRSFGNVFDLNVEMHEDKYLLRLGDWSAYEDCGVHVLRASLSQKTIFDAALYSTKSPVLNGKYGAGLSQKGNGSKSNHFSLTRMAIAGKIGPAGNSERFVGSAWMDREYGTWDQKNWDWFSVQLDDGNELMIYHFRNESGATESYSHVEFVDVDGNTRHLPSDEFVLVPTGDWRSTTTGTVYPSGWTLEVPALEMKLDITPFIHDQELNTRGTSMVVYWEGCCSITGTKAGHNITGKAYAELVGYDRSHERMNIGTFLFGDRFGWFTKRS
jgi:predicted secreted hydrolase